MHSRKIVLLCVLVAAPYLSGCAVMWRDEGVQLYRNISDTNRAVHRLESGPTSVATLMDESVNSRAESNARLDALQTKIDQLDGKLDENKYQIELLARKLDEFRYNIYRQMGITTPRSVRPPAATPTPPPVTRPPVPPTATERPPAEPPREEAPTPPRRTGLLDPAQDYQRAYQDFIKGRFEMAKMAFRDYITQYPDTDDTDNAQFWLAECYYKTSDFETAAREFQKVYTLYPDSNKIPDAKLKEAFALVALERNDEARGLLEDVIANYPGSSAAESAKIKLNALEG